MSYILDHPLLAVLPLSLVALYLSGWIGASVRKGRQKLDQEEREDYSLIVGAALTLLGLIIGFTFSMAIGRYEQRKNYEEAEANAIGTEYLRADLLPAADADRVRTLLGNYLDQRVLFYEAPDDVQLRRIDATTARLETDLWYAVQAPAMKQPTLVVPLAVSGMNDVLNSQGYTQAAWWNRIPVAAWVLMVTISVFCNLLIGYGMHRADPKKPLLLVLPLVVSVSFFLIADIDSPRGGIIRVNAQNLASLAQSLHTH
jgi:hypothetical protein